MPPTAIPACTIQANPSVQVPKLPRWSALLLQ